VTRLAWRYPEWWALALSAAAWASMFQKHAHHRAPMLQWVVMTAAMMFPMIAGSLRIAAERSLWRRRHRAIAVFLIGYVVCWLAFGMALVLLGVPARPEFAIGALAIAGIWQLTRAKRLALAGCHFTMPLAPKGWRADRDCLAYGWKTGTRCVISCWAIMLACFATGHSLIAMGGLTAICAIERYTYRPSQLLLGGTLIAAAIIIAVPIFA
jgi:predicted metal-binding membrane protein